MSCKWKHSFKLDKKNPFLQQWYRFYTIYSPFYNPWVNLSYQIRNSTACTDIKSILCVTDDDSKPVELVDKELDIYNEVNDANVVDYVLNMVNDYPMQEQPQFQKVFYIDQFYKVWVKTKHNIKINSITFYLTKIKAKLFSYYIKTKTNLIYYIW